MSRMMSADGRLSVRNAENDKDDEARVKRYEAWKERIDEIRQKDRPSRPGTGPGNDPFGR